MADLNKYHNGNVPSNGDSYQSFSGLSSFEKKEDDEINIKKLVLTLWNKKWFIIGAVIICGLVGAIYSYTLTPIYQSSGAVLIEESGGASPLGEEGLGQLLSSSYGIGAGSTIANELQVLRSRKLSRSIADSLISKPIM